MKVLVINKFLYPKGGSETYCMKLGNYFVSQGHEVQFFGMDHKDRCVGNHLELYMSNIDFHSKSIFAKLTYPFRIVYSFEAKKKIKRILEDFKPDVVHLNNFTYQITPSVMVAIENWRKRLNKDCRIVATIHDPQLVCPNHMLYNPNTQKLCENCLGGHYIACQKGRCIHGSLARSFLGAIEAYYWAFRKIYRQIDTLICPSKYIQLKMNTNPLFSHKTVVLQNFIEKVEKQEIAKEEYVLYFGRFTEEKGMNTLMEAVKRLPHIPFVFAGEGPFAPMLTALPNVKNIGFQTGDELDQVIRKAQFSICPSVLPENCPFSVMESQVRGTPVVGSNVGGISELIQEEITGKLFARNDIDGLVSAIEELWNDRTKVKQFSQACKEIPYDALSDYYKKILAIYEGKVST